MINIKSMAINCLIIGITLVCIYFMHKYNEKINKYKDKIKLYFIKESEFKTYFKTTKKKIKSNSFNNLDFEDTIQKIAPIMVPIIGVGIMLIIGFTVLNKVKDTLQTSNVTQLGAPINLVFGVLPVLVIGVVGLIAIIIFSKVSGGEE
jgi:hypothetical protein